MIRRSRIGKRSRAAIEAGLPSEEQIRELTAEIRKRWSPAQHARRAMYATRLQLMVVSALDFGRSAPIDDFYR
jgi:hypothetical protein